MGLLRRALPSRRRWRGRVRGRIASSFASAMGCGTRSASRRIPRCPGRPTGSNTPTRRRTPDEAWKDRTDADPDATWQATIALAPPAVPAREPDDRRRPGMGRERRVHRRAASSDVDDRQPRRLVRRHARRRATRASLALRRGRLGDHAHPRLRDRTDRSGPHGRSGRGRGTWPPACSFRRLVGARRRSVHRQLIGARTPCV